MAHARPTPIRVPQPRYADAAAAAGQPPFSHILSPKAVRALRPRVSPYRKTTGSSSSRSFSKPALPPLRRAEQRWGGPSTLSKDALSSLSRMAASCQHDRAAAIEQPVSLRDLLHRKNTKPDHARHELTRMAMSAPSAALLARDSVRPRKPSSAPLCRRPTASRVVALRRAPPVPGAPGRDVAIGRDVRLSPTAALSASPPPLIGVGEAGATMERATSAAVLPVIPDGVERPAPIELPTDEQQLPQPRGLDSGGSGGSPMSPDLCLPDALTPPTRMDDGFSPAAGDSPMCGIFSLPPSPHRAGHHRPWWSPPPPEVTAASSSTTTTTTTAAAAPPTDARSFSPPVQRPPPQQQQQQQQHPHSPPTVARARSLPAQLASTPPPLLLRTSRTDFSPPVLRPPSRLCLPTRSPAPPSPTEDDGSGKVSLLYDATLDCYFDPVTHRYFELR